MHLRDPATKTRKCNWLVKVHGNKHPLHAHNLTHDEALRLAHILHDAFGARVHVKIDKQGV